MKNVSLILSAACLLLAACNKPFKKGDNGLEYKIISDGKGKKLEFGKFMQFHMAQYYVEKKKDTLLVDSRAEGGVPMVEIFDSASMPPELYKICAQLRVGDSLILRMSTDSIIKRQQGMVPPFFKKGNYYLQTLKITNVFDKREQADSARLAARELAMKMSKIREAEQMKTDDKILNDYFKKNNLSPVKAQRGTYVKILQPGTGPLIDTTVVVKVKYTGRTLDGVVFDSNVDSAFGHTEPLAVNMTDNFMLGAGVIQGWADGLFLLSKGAKAVFYIPSPLAYGSRGAGDKIPANANLIFDVEILDILPEKVALAELKVKQDKEAAAQKRITDSLKKLQKDTASIKR